MTDTVAQKYKAKLTPEELKRFSTKPTVPAAKKLVPAWNDSPFWQFVIKWTRNPFFGIYFFSFIVIAAGIGTPPVLLPAMAFIFIGKRNWYRWWVDFWVGWWFYISLGMAEWVLGIAFFCYGDAPPSSGSSMIVMNHRTMFDYMWVWSMLCRQSFGTVSRFKVVLKDTLKLCPGLGWAIQLAGFFFLKRLWATDKDRVSEQVDFFCSAGRYDSTTLIFPEGTDFCPAGYRSSTYFADKMGLPHYHYCLHPRTTGLNHFVAKFRQWDNLDAIYDLTVGYPGYLPYTKTGILKGVFPQQIHLRWKRYENKDLPQDDEGMKAWCESLWAEKEEALKQFYEEGKFPGETTPNMEGAEKRGYILGLLAVLFWHAFVAFWCYMLWTSLPFFLYCLVAWGWATYMTIKTPGLDSVEIGRWRAEMKAKERPGSSRQKAE